MNQSNSVLADGCFDPFHGGHLDYLIAAKEWGRELIVNVAPDDAIRAKGREPFQSRPERARMLSSLHFVHAVTTLSLPEAIAMSRPAYLAKGADWRQTGLPQDVVDACQRFGTRIVYIDTQSRTSTERLNDRR